MHHKQILFNRVKCQSWRLNSNCCCDTCFQAVRLASHSSSRAWSLMNSRKPKNHWPQVMTNTHPASLILCLIAPVDGFNHWHAKFWLLMLSILCFDFARTKNVLDVHFMWSDKNTWRLGCGNVFSGENHKMTLWQGGGTACKTLAVRKQQLFSQFVKRALMGKVANEESQNQSEAIANSWLLWCIHGT